MTLTLTLGRPTKADEIAVLKEAAKALKKHDKLKQEMREAEDTLRALCREYDVAAGVWGFQPHHLRRACEARGLL